MGLVQTELKSAIGQTEQLNRILRVFKCWFFLCGVLIMAFKKRFVLNNDSTISLLACP